MRSELDDGTLFHELDAASRERALTLGRVRSYEHQACIHNKDEPADSAVIVLEGQVELTLTDSDGNISSYIAIHPGQLFGFISLFTLNRRRNDAYARGKTTLLYLDRNVLDQLIDELPSVRHYVVNVLASKLALALETISDDRTLKVKPRLAKRLLENVRSDGVVPLTQQQLAEYMSVSRYAVGKALGELQADGLLDICYGKVAIRDHEQLRALTLPG